MSKYTAERVLEYVEKAERGWFNPVHMEMLRDYATLLREREVRTDAASYTLGPVNDGGMDPRERESAKVVTDGMVTAAMLAYNVECHSQGDMRNAHGDGMHAALEAVAPMLASARVPDNLQAAIHKVAKGYLSRRQQGYFMGEIREMLAAAPKPEKE